MLHLPSLVCASVPARVSAGQPPPWLACRLMQPPWPARERAEATSAASPVLTKRRGALPNPSLKLSPNGGPRGPGRLDAVHFRQPGPRVPPLVPA